MSSIFIMSSERSGSNLLRMMLGTHSHLAAPPPPHLWRHLTEALPSYGPLTVEENFRLLVEDAVAMTQQSYAHLQWKYGFTPDQIIEASTSPTLGSVITSLYQAYAREEGTERWICKENNLFDHAHQIREHLPDAQFIYLCRDGRDVACSVKDMPTHDQHPYAIAKEWKEQQNKCLRVFQEISPGRYCTLVRYEDLIENPERVLRDICSFVGIDFEERMLYFHETEEAIEQAEKSQYWKNLSTQVMPDNKGNFFDQLSTREVQIFEAVAGDTLALLGYPLTTEPRQRTLSLWQKALYQGVNLIQSAIMHRELADWSGRKKRKAMLDRIHNRSLSDVRSSFASSFTYD